MPLAQVTRALLAQGSTLSPGQSGKVPEQSVELGTKASCEGKGKASDSHTASWDSILGGLGSFRTIGSAGVAICGRVRDGDVKPKVW